MRHKNWRAYTHFGRLAFGCISADLFRIGQPAVVAGVDKDGVFVEPLFFQVLNELPKVTSNQSTFAQYLAVDLLSAISLYLL